ncbi:MAG: class I SAM-dependent methyltransferase [Proteobacteria bacterium]|nr:class I SAM-dependent methyltransferase [Pseudomonadota bacterium]
MNIPNTYMLKVGNLAVDRLRLLDEIYGPYSHEFLLKMGLKSNAQILEVGCGTGNTTCWMAKHISPKGKVLGIDFSAEQIEVAKQQAQEQKLKNIEFMVLKVADLHEIKTEFDLVFCRFFLMHLNEPVQALQKMYERLRPKGILACDEQCFGAARCYPDSKAFNNLKDLVYTVSRSKGLDYDFGLKLYFEFKKLNLQHIHVQTVQPILLTETQKSLWTMFLQETKEVFLSSKIITQTAWDNMMAELEDHVHSENYYFLSVQNLQTWAVK